MAIAIDKASIGSAAPGGGATTVAFTTNQVVASGGFIVLSVGFWAPTISLSSVDGGGLTWVVDKQGTAGSPANPHVALVSAQAPSGLASGTTITATFSISADARSIAGTSFTGVAASSALDTTSGPSGLSSGTAWSCPSTSILAGSVLIASAYEETSATNSVITSPSIEALDWANGTNGYGQTTGYRIESSAGSYQVAGTWQATVSGCTVAAAYKAAAGGPSPVQQDFSWHYG